MMINGVKMKVFVPYVYLIVVVIDIYWCLLLVFFLSFLPVCL